MEDLSAGDNLEENSGLIEFDSARGNLFLDLSSGDNLEEDSGLKEFDSTGEDNLLLDLSVDNNLEEDSGIKEFDSTGKDNLLLDLSVDNNLEEDSGLKEFDSTGKDNLSLDLSVDNNLEEDSGLKEFDFTGEDNLSLDLSVDNNLEEDSGLKEFDSTGEDNLLPDLSADNNLEEDSGLKEFDSTGEDNLSLDLSADNNLEEDSGLKEFDSTGKDKSQGESVWWKCSYLPCKCHNCKLDKSSKTHECPTCSRKYERVYHLKRHIRTKHCKDLDFECYICRKRFNLKHVLERHRWLEHLCPKNDSTGKDKSQGESVWWKGFGLPCECSNCKLDKSSKTHECPTCSKKYEKVYHLKRHIRTKHCEDLDFECDICRKRFNLKHVLERHKWVKHLYPKNDSTGKDKSQGESVWWKGFGLPCECSNCKLDKSSKTHECPTCSKKYEKVYHLKRHIRTKHCEDLDFECDICRKRFNLKHVLERHKWVKHLCPKNFKCNSCPEKFKTDISLKRHVERMHCEEVMEEISVDDKLKTTVWWKGSHSPCECSNCKLDQSSKTHECPTCSKKYERVYHLKRHIRTKHCKDLDFECYICCKKFKLKSLMKRHLWAKHHSPRNFECDKCDKKCRTEFSLKRHFELRHNELRIFVCETCGKGFWQKEGLERHKKIHTDERKFVCESCGKGFKTGKAVACHKKRHLSEGKEFSKKPAPHFERCIPEERIPEETKKSKSGLKFECDICRQKFKTKYCMNRHRQQVHKNGMYNLISRYSCPFEWCGNKYVNVTRYKNHIATVHSDERPFACNMCGKKFKIKGHLRKHKLTVHVHERKFVCETNSCGKRFKTAFCLKKHKKTHSMDRVKHFEYKMINGKVEKIRRHDGLHNYKCIRCKEVFKFRSQLSRHLKNSEKCEGKGELTQQPKASRQFNGRLFRNIRLALKSFKGSRLFIRRVNYFVENRTFPYKRL